MFAHAEALAPNTYAPDADQALGQIAVKLPGATAVFRRWKLDFCCGGQLSLRKAAAAKGLDAQAVLAELLALQHGSIEPVASDPAALIGHILTRYHAVHRDQLPELIRMADRVEAVHRDHPQVPAGLADLLKTMEQELLVHTEKEASDPAALIGHILTRYHAVHRDQLPELIRMADRVEAVHRDHPQVPAGLADLLKTMEQELLVHMEKEETILFPMLLDGGNPFVSDPIEMMRAEHVDHGALLDQLAALTHDTTAPEGACTTWRALYSGVNQLTDDLMNHIHLENNLLFAQFDDPATGQPDRPL